MSRWLFIFLCFAAVSLSAQTTDRIREATQLHQAGQALLQKESPRAFDKIQALGKFQESQQLLDGEAVTNQDLFNKK